MDSNTMQVPLDDAVLAQTWRSQLHVWSDLFPRSSVGLVDTTQSSLLEQSPGNGTTFTRVRTDARTRIARRPRPTSSALRARIPWTCGTGIPTLEKPAQIYRRQLPGRLRRLSTSVSPGRRLAVDSRNWGLLQEALRLDAAEAASEVPTSGLEEGFAPLLVAHDFWPLEGWNIGGKQPIPLMGPSEREDPVMMPCLEPAEGKTPESSSDSPLNGIDQPEESHLRLDPSHRLWRVKDSVVKHAQARFAQSFQSIQKEDPGKWIPLFACPFFRKDPAKYWPCLADTSMTAILGVKRHLWRHHSQPYHCPVCYEIFTVASKRDIHIMERTCEKKDMVHFDSMTPEQKTLISAGFKGYSEPDQWRRIWNLLFGRLPRVLEPFLSTGLSRKITLLTTFWKAKGKEITEKFLSDIGAAEEGPSSQGNDDTAVSALANAVLRDLVGLAFWRSALGLDLGII